MTDPLKIMDELKGREHISGYALADLRAAIEAQAEELEQAQAQITRLKSLFEEGFNSGDDHDLDAWEERAKRVLHESTAQYEGGSE